MMKKEAPSEMIANQVEKRAQIERTARDGRCDAATARRLEALRGTPYEKGVRDYLLKRSSAR